MADRPLILVLSHDLSLAAAKTSRFLARALDRLGATAIQRDTRLIRWTLHQLQQAGNPTRTEAYQSAVEAKWSKIVNDYGVKAVVSLDLHWLLTPHLFFKNNTIKQIHSFWFDDLRSHLQTAPMFDPAPQTLLDLMNHEKVTHHGYGQGQRDELAELGVKNIRASALAAPADYLRGREPCTEPKRLAFIGNPGLSLPPSFAALTAMQQKADLFLLRKIARLDLLKECLLANPAAEWIKQHPTVRDLLAEAMTQRIHQPYRPALSLLKEVGQAYAGAFAYLNQRGAILDAALLVKLVNRYDRPAVVYRLWQRGWVDVFGAPEEWAGYGLKAAPTVSFPRLPEIYRRYGAHVNAPNCARDATANEKLFEIAACGRTSLNLDSPDVRACYGDREIVLAESLDALEHEAEKIVRDSSAALEKGQRARERTAAEHLWDHRLKGVLAL